VHGPLEAEPRRQRARLRQPSPGVDPLLVPNETPGVLGAGTVCQILDFKCASVVEYPVLQNETCKTFGAEPYLEATSVTPRQA
jgi:hypothetical protein